MANPGSPQQQQQMQQNMPAMPKGMMSGMLIMMLIMMIVMMFRQPIGQALNVVFQFIGFGGQYPVLTLIIAGLVMITLSTVLRGFLTDSIDQARSQQIQSAFTAEMRQARLENNLFKLKKLTEQQPQLMANQMRSSGQMMKTMPLTMIVVIPIYAWVWFFLETTVAPELWTVMLPWGTANLMDTVWFMPMWIILYTMISLPIGQLENRLVRYYLLKKRLKELDAKTS